MHKVARIVYNGPAQRSLVSVTTYQKDGYGMANVVESNKVISVAYTLRLASGEVVDYSDEEDPLEYLHGAGNIIPGLERALSGLAVGEKRDVEVQPEDGYGFYNPEEVEVVERQQFPASMKLQRGMQLEVTDEMGNVAEAYVREVNSEQVTLDFNHPLAGQTLFFSVEVLGIREATEDEIAHGHVHGAHFEDEEDFDDEDEDFDEDDDYDYDDEDDEDFDDEDEDDLDDDDDIPVSSNGRLN
jgi:FKBP-type peptidyl-prolyl cis-trans isomerase SlyD